MQFVARGLGARIATSAPRFEPECAPAGVSTGRLLGPRRPVGPDALPTELQLHSNLIFEPILKNGTLKERATIEAPLLGLAFQNGAHRTS